MLKNPKVLLILATAMNLRLAITAVTPLFTAIQRSLHVTSSLTALLITLPLLCFSLGAIATPHLIQRFGPTTLLWTTNALLLLASLLRPVTTDLLLTTTIVIGLAVAILNVLVPTLIAQTTVTGATRLTSAYAVTMNVVAALGTAIAIPLATQFSWQLVLQGFGLPALVTLALLWWAPHHLFAQPTTDSAPSVSLRATLQHDKQARWLTVFMGLQSLIFYSLTTWLPTIFHALDATTATSGNLLAVFQLVGIPAALVLTRVTNLRYLLWSLLVGYAVGGLTLLWPGLGWWLAAGLLGFTSSLIFTLALTLIATSSSHVNAIANRSAVAQSLGYLLAAVGPVLLGQIHDFTGSWGPVLGVLGGLVLLTIGVGLRLTRTSH
ncbi:MFS transporter [Levilactobacillus wangkuiensis]|uniref:MFS transporter n=1 Tax=Levilactobacillus wangkuiensis TaxID=2799566 RepID=UPI0019412C65|nr:MFS transporter [Levilactobacillus wangkuiensis]